jgi:hypothetical protein
MKPRRAANVGKQKCPRIGVTTGVEPNHLAEQSILQQCLCTRIDFNPWVELQLFFAEIQIFQHSAAEALTRVCIHGGSFNGSKQSVKEIVVSLDSLAIKSLLDNASGFDESKQRVREFTTNQHN